MQSGNMQEKQKYLRENILESGYDPNDFVAFLQHNENIDHIDIQGWSMKKIEQLVGAFKQYKYYTSKQQNEPTSEKKKIFAQRQKKSTSKVIQQEKNKGSDKSLPEMQLLSDEGGKMIYEKQKMSYYQQIKTKIEYPRYSPLFDYEFKGKCKCAKQQKLINDQLKVQVPKFQIVQSPGLFLGLGSKTQIWYVINSNIKKQTTVRRLLQDFDWLSSSMIRLYPYLALPELPEYKKDIENAYEKRRVEVQEYLKVLIGRKQLHHSNLLYDFITVHNEKMEKVKKCYDNIGFSKGVGLLKSQLGQVEVQYSKRLREFEESSHLYSKKVLPIHEKITQCIAKTVQSMEVVVTNINFIVDYFAQLHQVYNELMNKFPQQKSSQYNQILVNMNNLFLGISQSIKGHAFNLQKHLKDYFKTNVLNDKNIIRLQKYVKEEEKNYLDYKYNLMRKKERLINQPEKWDVNLKNIPSEKLTQLKSDKDKVFDIMLPRETQQQNEIKSWMAFLYTHYVNEFTTYIKESTQRYAFNYKSFTTDLLTNDKNYLEALTKFLTQSRKLLN